MRYNAFANSKTPAFFREPANTTYIPPSYMHNQRQPYTLGHEPNRIKHKNPKNEKYDFIFRLDAHQLRRLSEINGLRMKKFSTFTTEQQNDILKLDEILDETGG